MALKFRNAITGEAAGELGVPPDGGSLLALLGKGALLFRFVSGGEVLLPDRVIRGPADIAFVKAPVHLRVHLNSHRTSKLWDVLEIPIGLHQHLKVDSPLAMPEVLPALTLRAAWKLWMFTELYSRASVSQFYSVFADSIGHDVVGVRRIGRRNLLKNWSCPGRIDLYFSVDEQDEMYLTLERPAGAVSMGSPETADLCDILAGEAVTTMLRRPW